VSTQTRAATTGFVTVKALMAANSVRSSDVHCWARVTGRPCPPVGIPPRNLVEAYLFLRRVT